MALRSSGSYMRADVNGGDLELQAHDWPVESSVTLHVGDGGSKEAAIAQGGDLDEAAARVTPLPKFAIACVCATQLNEALMINVLFPFLVFMVEGFGYTGTELGWHAGLLASSFCGAQFFSSMFWGRISDQFGIKPCLVIGTAGSAAFFFLFGMSGSYAQCVAARFGAGLLNGNMGVLKSYIGKITDTSNRAAGFTYMSIAWGVGTCIAPVMGGCLVSPAETWPEHFRGTVLEHKPFLLPCGAVGCYGLAVAAALACTMQEPEPEAKAKAKPEADGRRADGRRADGGRCDEAHTELPKELPPKELPRQAAGLGGVEKEGGGATGDRSRFQQLLGDRPPRGLPTGLPKEQGFAPLAGEDPDRADPPPAQMPDVRTCGARDREVCDRKGGRELLVGGGGGSDADPAADPAAGREEFSLWRGNHVLIACLAYVALAMVQQMFDEALPLFMKLDEAAGGLGFSEGMIGACLAFGGTATTLLSLLVVPRVERAVGSPAIYKGGVAACLPLFSLFWAVGAAWRRIPRPAGWALVQCCILWKNCGLSFAFSGSFVMISNSAPSERMGQVNGLAQTGAALARATGPAICGGVWTLGTALHLVPLAFLASGAGCAACLYLATRIPLELRYPLRGEH